MYVIVVYYNGTLYVETTGTFLLGDASYGQRAMPHTSLLHVTLYNILYFYISYSVAASSPPRPLTKSARS